MRMRWAATTVRWTSLVLAMVLAGCWLAMVWRGVRWEGMILKSFYSCDFARGALSVEYCPWDGAWMLQKNIDSASVNHWTLLRRASAMKWKPLYEPRHDSTLLGGFNPTRVWFSLPLWAPISLLGLVGAAPWGIVIRRQRAKLGLCRSCGYDRRGLAEDAPCPECGVSATKP
jgi:hypothetical protein